MSELHLWRWQYTNENGKRVESSWRMTEATVRAVRARLPKRRNDQGHAGDPEAAGLDGRLAALATYIRAGNLYESAWQLMKFGHFKGMEDKAAALALGNWARRNQIHIMFEVRRVLKRDVLYVLMRDKRN
jgi:hypothetical protein